VQLQLAADPRIRIFYLLALIFLSPSALREPAHSALYQISQQVRRHRQLGERQAGGGDLLDRTADARCFRMGRCAY